MKVISLPETAFEVLTAANGTMTFAELYGKVAEIAEMSEEEKAARIGQFYTDISLDGRFVGLTDNTWDLRSRHTYDKVHISVSDIYDATEADQADVDPEENEGDELAEPTGEESEEGEGNEEEESSGNAASLESFGINE